MAAMEIVTLDWPAPRAAERVPLALTGRPKDAEPPELLLQHGRDWRREPAQQPDGWHYRLAAPSMETPPDAAWQAVADAAAHLLRALEAAPADTHADFWTRVFGGRSTMDAIKALRDGAQVERERARRYEAGPELDDVEITVRREAGLWRATVRDLRLMEEQPGVASTFAGVSGDPTGAAADAFAAWFKARIVDEQA